MIDKLKQFDQYMTVRRINWYLFICIVVTAKVLEVIVGAWT